MMAIKSQFHKIEAHFVQSDNDERPDKHKAASPHHRGSEDTMIVPTQHIGGCDVTLLRNRLTFKQ